MKTKIVTEAMGAVIYTTIANHISTTVSELPDYLAHHRNVSGVYGMKNAGNCPYRD